MKPFHFGSRTRRLGGLLPLAPLFVSPLLMGQTTTPEAQVQRPAKPSFQASGIHGTTAPSGYSGGATEEHGKQAATLAARLLENNLLDLLEFEPAAPCSQQATLLHTAFAQPGSYEANERLGIFYLRHRSAGLARKYLLLASTLKQQDRQALLFLAIADVQEHSYAEALDAAEKILRVDMGNAAAHRIRGTVEALNGKNADALAEYRLAAKLNPSDSNRFAEGLALLLLGSSTEAEQQLLAATVARPGSALLRFGLGLTEAILGKTAQSIEALLKATELDPDHVLAYSLLAQQSGGSAAADTAILARMEVLVQRHPALAVAHYDHAIVLYRMGTASDAIASLRAAAAELSKAISEDEDFAAAHFQLSIVDDDLLQRGDVSVTRPSVVSHLQRAVELDPGIPEWHYRLARAYAADHQGALSAAELRKFRELKQAQGEGSGASTVLEDALAIQAMHPSTPCATVTAR
jgi:tetratricopeptide (TPR) repeat protein